MQCLGLRLLTDPSPENQTRPQTLRELHPACISAFRVGESVFSPERPMQAHY